MCAFNFYVFVRLGGIVASWVISPIFSGLVAVTMYAISDTIVIHVKLHNKLDFSPQSFSETQNISQVPHLLENPKTSQIFVFFVKNQQKFHHL